MALLNLVRQPLITIHIQNKSHCVARTSLATTTYQNYQHGHEQNPSVFQASGSSGAGGNAPAHRGLLSGHSG